MSGQPLIRTLADETATSELGAALQRHLQPGTVVFLSGHLGAGKTTLVRGYLRAAGFRGAVKSPTFTVAEGYRVGALTVHHFDLYRLASPEELEWLGIRDYLGDDTLCFFEWPERGEGVLPEPDIEITLTFDGTGRRATLRAVSTRGGAVLAALSKPLAETAG